MTTRLKVSRCGAISWPRKCALCGGGDDVAFVDTYASKLKSVMPYVLWLTVKWDTQLLSFPVCPRHKRLGSVGHFLAPRSLVWLFVFLITGSAVIDVLVSRNLWSDAGPHIAVYLVFISGVVIWARIVAPVSVTAFDDNSMWISFRSAQYAQEFEAANAEVILEKNGYAYGGAQVSASPTASAGSGQGFSGWQSRRYLLLGIAAIVAAMLVFPPFRVLGPQGAVLRTGYAFIFDLPHRASIDVGQLIIQWIGVLIVGAIAYILIDNPS